MLKKIYPKLKIKLTPSILINKFENFFRRFKLPPGSICESIRDDISEWSPPHPVIIDAHTGSGKTTLIYEELIPRIFASGRTLLIVSNRIALSAQQKFDILKRLNDPRIKELTMEGIRKLEDLGLIRVLTYHRLASLLHDPNSKSWLAKLDYVVFDEFHFFTADSCFNQNCDYILKLATSKFCKAIRIYMSATTWDVLEPLAEAEIQNYHYRRYPQPSIPLGEAYHYYLPANYDGYRLHFFKALKDLLAPIAEDPTVKWLIFVDNKATGKAFADILGDQALYLDADSKESDEWKNLLKDQHFNTQVLICTSALDCGVNIWDDALQNVVIITDDHTSFIQALGRKRRTNNAPVHLWVQDISKQTIAARNKQCVEWLQWYQRLEICQSAESRMKIAKEIWREKKPALQNLFRLTETDLYPNKLARYMIARRHVFYEQILDGTTTFRSEVKKWLGFSENTDYGAEVETFFREYGNHPLTEDQFSDLRALVVRLYQEAGFSEPQRKRLDTLGAQALSNRLSDLELPYRIKQINGSCVLERIPDN